MSIINSDNPHDNLAKELNGYPELITDNNNIVQSDEERNIGRIRTKIPEKMIKLNVFESDEVKI